MPASTEANIKLDIRQWEIEKELLERAIKKGSGKSDDGGLYDDQLDRIMKKEPDYYGSIMRDEIPMLLPYISKRSRVGFIINLDKSTGPGTHWCAIYIDARPNGSNSLEYFDSFGRPIPSDILRDTQLILKKLKPNTVLKVKENRVVHQSDNTSNCGWFASKYLIDRFRNKPFSEASGYDDKVKISNITHDEKEIEKFKHMPQFKYII